MHWKAARDPEQTPYRFFVVGALYRLDQPGYKWGDDDFSSNPPIRELSQIWPSCKESRTRSVFYPQPREYCWASKTSNLEIMLISVHSVCFDIEMPDSNRRILLVEKPLFTQWLFWLPAASAHSFDAERTCSSLSSSALQVGDSWCESFMLLAAFTEVVVLLRWTSICDYISKTLVDILCLSSLQIRDLKKWTSYPFH